MTKHETISETEIDEYILVMSELRKRLLTGEGSKEELQKFMEWRKSM